MTVEQQLQQEVQELKRRLTDLESRSRQPDYFPGSIKQRFIDGYIIYRGLDDDKPTDGDNTQKWFYFATDTNTLYIWNGTAYVSEVFS